MALLIFSVALGDMANIFFVSMETYRGPDRGFELNLTDLICWGLSLMLLTRSLRTIRWISFNTIWMFGYFCMALVSTFVAASPILSLFTLSKLIKSFILYWCIYNCVRSGEINSSIFYGILAIGVLVTILVIRQKYMQGVYRVPGPFDHSNTLPLFLNPIIPVLLIMSLCDKNLPAWQSLAGIIFSLGMVFGVVATFSRAGTALTGLILFGVMIYANYRAGSRRSYLTSALLFFALLIGGLKAADSFLNRIESAPEASEHAREEFNYAAQLMLADHPLGIGVNNFSYVLTRNSRYHEHIQVMANEESSGVCHHIYNLTAAEMGYPGVILFIIVIFRFVILALWRTFQGNRLENHILFAIFLGQCALHASGLLEWAFRITPVFYMFVIVSALCAAFADQVQRNAIRVKQ